jgi:hypothetical protein
VLCDEAGYRFQELREAGEKFPADRLRGGDRLIDVAQDLTRAIEQRLARDCEFDAMCRTPQQLAVDELFEPGDLAAQRRLRNEEPFRGSAEVEFLCHGDECPQVAQLDAVRRLRERKHVSGTQLLPRVKYGRRAGVW